LCREARTAAERALAGNPALAPAHTALGAVRAVHDWDWRGAEASFASAISAAPSYATAHHWLALECLAPQGRHAEAQDAMLRARDLDPLAPAIAASVGVQHYFARDFDAAEAAHAHALELDPHFGIAHFFLGQTYAARGRFDRALAAFEQAAALAGASAEIVAARGHALAGAGRAADAEAALADLAGRRDWVSPVLAATVLVGLGRHGDALDALEAAAQARAADLIWIGVRPTFDPLRGERRFRLLLRRMGLGRTGDRNGDPE
jgi:serine/threonine-protein kinase